MAHGSDEDLGDAYDRTSVLMQRRKMAQEWADYLDSLEKSDVIGNDKVAALTDAQHKERTSGHGDRIVPAV